MVQPKGFEHDIVELFREVGLPDDGGEMREFITELVRLYRQGFLHLYELRERLEKMRSLPEEAFFD